MTELQSKVDSANSAFWDTLCGTNLACELGITDRSASSLESFDDWFFKTYPYLDEYIPFGTVAGRRVLEVGLGYGTVAQKLAMSGANYIGLDIAEGPVEMANYRMALHNLSGRAQQGSILEAPFPDQSFDLVVAIGCYHHTGNLQRAIDESYRLLAPRGTLVCMVYNALSYRRWYTSPWTTLRYLAARRRVDPSSDERRAYDRSPDGDAAPHTDFVSRSHLRSMCSQFSEYAARLENITNEPPFTRWSREQLLRAPIARFLGLDIYATILK